LPAAMIVQLESSAIKGINLTTFDTPTELLKIKRCSPLTQELLLLICQLYEECVDPCVTV
jgi:hypothetical protein